MIAVKYFRSLVGDIDIQINSWISAMTYPNFSIQNIECFGTVEVKGSTNTIVDCALVIYRHD